MAQNWSIDSITDETYRKKFVDVGGVIGDWTRDHGGIAGRDVLDFGCGEGTMALSIALQYGARRVVGIDVHKEIENCLPYARAQLGIERLPDNLELLCVQPDALLDDIGQFDVVYSWSVFEHVSQHLLLTSLATLKRLMRPSGIMFLQTTPLFYSAEGSHLKPWVPEPWAHLRMQQDLFIAEFRRAMPSRAEADQIEYVYDTLNRVTAPQLLRLAQRAGFEIVREYRTYDNDEIPPELGEIYKEDVLRTNQLVFLARHAST